MSIFPEHHTPLPDSPAANSQGCRCPAAENKAGEGIVETDKDGCITRSFTISPECKVHTPQSAWRPKPLVGSGD